LQSSRDILIKPSGAFALQKFQLVLLVHAHQPVGNFDDVIERAYQLSYLPFMQLLEKFPSARMGVHFSGSLLDWIERAHPEYFDLLRTLVKRNQVEMVGGGHFEPILISIPMDDRREQIERLGDYLQEHFGQRPRGAWLTERVWEPQLPSTLAPAGIDYTLVDDNHFLGAGFDPTQLHGSYIAEDLGSCVKLIPGLKSLRYLLPFREPSETISFLRSAAAEQPGGFAAMGDDLEKFGVWPGTYKLCYTDGWLENLYKAIEANSDWLELATPGEAIRSRSALGLAELPASSYNEMMEWSLPTAARLRFEKLEKEFADRPDVLIFLRGGIWRSFMAKYSEANLMHKKMLHVSEKLHKLTLSRRRGASFLEKREQVETNLLRGQCNDAYWHGIFGGLYSPHLRTAVWRSLIEAESLADTLFHREPQWTQSREFDFDSDGRDEIYFTSNVYSVLLSPADGASISDIDYRPGSVAVINSLTRRVEAYHSLLKQASTADASKNGEAVSIHDQVKSKEPGLEKLLRYDHWVRNCARLLVFPRDKSFQDYAELNLDEHRGIAAGNYRIMQLGLHSASLHCEDAEGWNVIKKFAFESHDSSFDISCDLEITPRAAASVCIGLENVINFLAPDTPDRYIEAPEKGLDKRHPLRWQGTVSGGQLGITDQWQDVTVGISAGDAKEMWVAPIETVSESEEGFERVYQGSQILALWPVQLRPGATWRGRVVLHVSKDSARSASESAEKFPVAAAL
jgi:4-alpha-glucanotransferase